MRCRYRDDCPDAAVVIVCGRIVCRHHGAFLLDLAIAQAEDWHAESLGGVS